MKTSDNDSRGTNRNPGPNKEEDEKPRAPGTGKPNSKTIPVQSIDEIPKGFMNKFIMSGVSSMGQTATKYGVPGLIAEMPLNKPVKSPKILQKSKPVIFYKVAFYSSEINASFSQLNQIPKARQSFASDISSNRSTYFEYDFSSDT